MTDKTEAQRLADSKPTSIDDDLYAWADEAADELLRLEAENAALRALLAELVDIEGPQPGNSEWAGKVRAALSGTAPARTGDAA